MITPPGSSPRLRGTRDRGRPSAACRRFIPASAGNTPPRPAWPDIASVHPRVCGEHTSMSSANMRTHGSSPRLRGTLGDDHARAFRARFIPASAGNTAGIECRRICRPVHPRVCGEHASFTGAISATAGSSPRLRGTLAALWLLVAELRFIPASAGNTRQGLTTRDDIPVHPRVCGEHDALVAGPMSVVGSSPRLRGTLGAVLAGHELQRFIPAFAGNTHPGTGS